MRALTRSPLIAIAAAAAVVLTAGTADAACKKMAFLVNDYGKEGPTKDAQDLLDKHVAEWAAQNGIAKYTIGKKDVKCELYIDVILFDEHTCTATANVCWDEPGKEKPAKSAKEKGSEPATKSAGNEKAASEKQPAAAEEKAAEKTAEKAIEAVADKPAATTIETGAIQSEEAKPAAAPATTPEDAAQRAAAAAERAAEAAERAAAAAERAAAASSAAPAAPSQLEMPAFGAGKPADVAPVTPVEPKS